MITISLTFPAGRYHATPWGRHVNEGAVEWPPSPWRILRALIAAWKRTLPELSQEDVEPILFTLVESLPEFLLPPASTGHTRHFMPWFKKGPDDRTLVFDTFVVVCSDAPLIVRWADGTLEASQRDTLRSILRNLNTFGRAESWCDASLLEDDKQEAIDPALEHEGYACVPLNGQGDSNNHEIVRLLCPDPESAFRDDHVVNAISKTTGRGKNNKTVRERATIYDPAWNICMETLQLHRERWSDPPGSRWVPYIRPRDCFKIEARPRFRQRSRPAPQVVRFALDSTVLPQITETLPLAESSRRGLMFHLVNIRGRHQYGGAWSRDEHRDGRQRVSLAGAFSGKDERGQPLSGHGHAFYLPTDEDGDGRIDHLTLVARNGFGPDEMRALDRLHLIRPRGRDNSSHPVRVLLLGYGRLDEYSPEPLRASRVWESATPYIATRYAKTRGRNRIDLRSGRARMDFLVSDLRTQIRESLGLDDETLKRVAIVPILDGDAFKVASRWRPIEFKRYRAKPGDGGGQRLAGAFRVTLPEAVAGPLALGWSSHFGMGLFLPTSGFES